MIYPCNHQLLTGLSIENNKTESYKKRCPKTTVIHKPPNTQQKTDMSTHLTRVCLSAQSLLLSSPVAPVVGLQMGAAGATAGSKQQELLLQDFMTVSENS